LTLQKVQGGVAMMGLQEKSEKELWQLLAKYRAMRQS